MVSIVFIAELFDMPKKYGANIKPQKQADISAEGMELIINMLQGVGAKATFVCSQNFAEFKPKLVEKAAKNGNTVIAPENYKPLNSKVLGVNLSGVMIQHLPMDLFSLLVKIGAKKELTIQIPVWAASDALYEEPLKIPEKFSENCGDKLIQRLATLIITLKSKNLI